MAGALEGWLDLQAVARVDTAMRAPSAPMTGAMLTRHCARCGTSTPTVHQRSTWVIAHGGVTQPHWCDACATRDRPPRPSIGRASPPPRGARPVAPPQTFQH